MEIAELKHKLRKIKSLEFKIRYGDTITKRPVLVWDTFFDLREKPNGKARYSLERLAGMSREEYKAVIDEYWFFVYRDIFGDPLHISLNRSESILLKWELPPDADAVAVKRRFHELAKLYHPDTGGSDEEFIELMNEYKKLTGI
jgi:hypothetical protein